MKKQSGFTLIELLLVLAIIGIISAIAIPALLGQRARARDKTAVSNCDSVIADGIGSWDRFRESGLAASAAIASVKNAIINTHTKDMDPWLTSKPAYLWASGAITAKTTTSGFMSSVVASTLGQVKLFHQLPSSGGGPGFIGGAVKLNAAFNGSTTYKKVSAIE
jgi:prepilin-type N-terminal cleavage/methylation domain-containing protein